MADRRVLFIVHGHSAERAGGAEHYAAQLHRALRDHDGWEPTLLARSGPPHSTISLPADGRRIVPANGAIDELLLLTDGYEYDWLNGAMRGDKSLLTRHLRALLRELQPDVVHFQHTLFIGYEAIREVRRTLPRAVIVVTLHEFLPICHQHGQMVRAADGSLCDHESPERCAECFPDISPERFVLRKRYVQAQFALVDLFVAPSRLVRDRFVAWGIAPERILLEDYGHLEAAAQPVERRAPHTVFGFFGQLTPFKGIEVLLRAIALAASDAPADRAPLLHVHGANLDLQERSFRERIGRALDAPRVISRGPYAPADVGGLMDEVDWVVVPSTWWENSPLVVAEAFARRRPVICSDVGGMAEKVDHDRDGLRFRPGDPRALAGTLRRAVVEDGLWERLRAGIRPPHRMSAHVDTLTTAYEGLLR